MSVSSRAPRRPRSRDWAAAALMGSASLCSCGRSDLLDEAPPVSDDGAVPLEDASGAADVNRAPPVEAPDAATAPTSDDASPDGDVDFDAGTANDGLPPLDGCPQEAALGYVVTSAKNLYSFDPRTAVFTLVGPLACPTPTADWRPYSFAVDRAGDAYALFVSGQMAGRLYGVDTATAACKDLDSPPAPASFTAYGMGFVRHSGSTGDDLYAASNDSTGAPGVLGRIAIPSLTLQVVAPFAGDTVENAELAGTGNGELFALYPIDGGTTSAIAQIDPTTAKVLAKDDLRDLPLAISFTGASIGGWAFLAWSSQFFLFTTDIAGNGTGSIVTRFDPSDQSQVEVASLPEVIVGAGVSTCGP